MPASAHQEKVGSVSKCATAATYIATQLISRSSVGQANPPIWRITTCCASCSLLTIAASIPFKTKRYPKGRREPIRYCFLRLESPRFGAKSDNEYSLSHFAKPHPFALRGQLDSLFVNRRTTVFANPATAGRLMSPENEGERHERRHHRSPRRDSRS